MLWWNKPPILDFVAGRSAVKRCFSIECAFGAMSREELVKRRNGSPLSRAEFYARAFPEPDVDNLVS